MSSRPDPLKTALYSLEKTLELVEMGDDESFTSIIELSPLLQSHLLGDDSDYNLISQGQGIWSGAASAPCFSDTDVAIAYLTENPSARVILATEKLRPGDAELAPSLDGIITGAPIFEGTHEKLLLASLGVPCIANSKNLTEWEQGVFFGDVTVKNGQHISMSSMAKPGRYNVGDVYLGQREVKNSEIIEHVLTSLDGEEIAPTRAVKIYQEFMKHAHRLIERYGGLSIYMFASSAYDVRFARQLCMSEGCSCIDGVGMVKTEQYFSDRESRNNIIKLALSRSKKCKDEAREAIFDKQYAQAKQIIDEVGDQPVQIRLLDSINEILHGYRNDAQVCNEYGIERSELSGFLNNLADNDSPFARGPDFTRHYPEIYRAQIEAIVKATLDSKKGSIKPRVIIPFVRDGTEVGMIRGMVEAAYAKYGVDPETGIVDIGSMIETPVACDTVKEQYAMGARHFVFGTNDLSKTYLAKQRSSSVPRIYGPQQQKENDPFETLDPYLKDVLRRTVDTIKSLDDKVSFGVSGRHAIFPKNVRFFYGVLGMDYIAVPLFEIPKAVLNVAKAAYTNPR